MLLCDSHSDLQSRLSVFRDSHFPAAQNKARLGAGLCGVDMFSYLVNAAQFAQGNGQIASLEVAWFLCARCALTFCDGIEGTKLAWPRPCQYLRRCTVQCGQGDSQALAFLFVVAGLIGFRATVNQIHETWPFALLHALSQILVIGL